MSLLHISLKIRDKTGVAPTTITSPRNYKLVQGGFRERPASVMTKIIILRLITFFMNRKKNVTTVDDGGKQEK